MMCLQCGAKFPDDAVNEHVCEAADLPTRPLRLWDFVAKDGRVFRLDDFDQNGLPIWVQVTP